jgi:integrase/recombinase XerD
VNQLRQLMLEELQRRNFADTTIRTYLHGVTHFSRYFRRPPDQLGPEDIRKYQAMLFTKLKFSPNTVILRLAALRFFYIHVLKRGWSIAETPYPKKVRHLPGVLSQEEVARLIEAADTPFHRVLLMTMYATGARRAEAAHLKVSDIDSQRMVAHTRCAKLTSRWHKDRAHHYLDCLAMVEAQSELGPLTDFDRVAGYRSNLSFCRKRTSVFLGF